ncbi:MAG: hypothetical protein A3I03_13300 [Candidatus Rokubacteria bacterium RIFCSPLOWO2_02_FULL_68_19]|nr:MAG: hypothetical protein A3I03_13300 [Candidatus Rokubacteria bacterium RIFCSPLOWO2_02_FULL_68_19]
MNGMRKGRILVEYSNQWISAAVEGRGSAARTSSRRRPTPAARSRNSSGWALEPERFPVSSS